MYGVTPKQKRCLDYIKSYIADNGYPPTTREIQAGLGLSSTNQVWRYIHSLRERGAIDFMDGRARSIEVRVG